MIQLAEVFHHVQGEEFICCNGGIDQVWTHTIVVIKIREAGRISFKVCFEA